jgi:hypothetical protein
VWKPTRSAPSSPRSRRSRSGRVRKSSSEEPYPGVRQALAQHLRQEQELVIVHPDQVIGLVVLGDDVGESLVHLNVGVPVAYVERHLIQEIMEEGPEDPIGEPLVVAGYLIGGEGNSHQPHGSKLFIQLGTLGGRELLGCT